MCVHSHTRRAPGRYKSALYLINYACGFWCIVDLLDESHCGGQSLAAYLLYDDNVTEYPTTIPSLPSESGILSLEN